MDSSQSTMNDQNISLIRPEYATNSLIPPVALFALEVSIFTNIIQILGHVDIRHTIENVFFSFS